MLKILQNIFGIFLPCAQKWGYNHKNGRDNTKSLKYRPFVSGDYKHILKNIPRTNFHAKWLVYCANIKIAKLKPWKTNQTILTNFLHGKQKQKTEITVIRENCI